MPIEPAPATVAVRDPEDWGREAWRAPPLADGDTLTFDEPGRIIGRIDYRSHYFRVVKSGTRFFLMVKHGLGVERHDLSVNSAILIQGLERLPADERYIALHALYDLPARAKREGAEKSAREYSEAFAEGRLKKRKQRNQNRARVWIEPNEKAPEPLKPASKAVSAGCAET